MTAADLTRTVTVADFAPVATAITELVALAPHLPFPLGISAHVYQGQPCVDVYGLSREQAKAWGDFLGQYEEHTSKATSSLHATADGVVAGVEFHAISIVPAEVTA